MRDPARSYGLVGTEEFQFKYRGVVCQVADWAGYVPGLGIAVGVARVALSVFGLIGCAVSSVSIGFVFVCSDDDIYCGKMFGKVGIVAQRALHELFRGLAEIIQPINWIMEAVTIDQARNSGTLNSMRPTGPVYYVNKSGVVCYPWKEYDAFNDKYNADINRMMATQSIVHPL